MPHLPQPFYVFEEILALVNGPLPALSLGEDKSEEAISRRPFGEKWRAKVRAVSNLHFVWAWFLLRRQQRRRNENPLPCGAVRPPPSWNSMLTPVFCSFSNLHSTSHPSRTTSPLCNALTLSWLGSSTSTSIPLLRRQTRKSSFLPLSLVLSSVSAKLKNL